MVVPPSRRDLGQQTVQKYTLNDEDGHRRTEAGMTYAHAYYV